MNKTYLTAAEAAAELNVSRATLYAYVSRGLVRALPVEGRRSKLYAADDVRALRQRRAPATEADTAGGALQFGGPVLESAITLIADGRLYYRGRDLAGLLPSASLESIAGLLWQCSDDPFAEPAPPLPAGCPDSVQGIDRALAILPVAAAADLRALNLEAASVAVTGARILRLMVASQTGRAPASIPLHRQLAEAWNLDEAGADLIRAALVASADHELNASAFTVRCVASTRATPYGAVIAGLTALQGPRHGGMTARVQAFVRECRGAAAPADAVVDRLRRGEPLPGFGHPLYPQADPRAALLLARLAGNRGENDGYRLCAEVARAVADLAGKAPNIDFSLVAVQHALSLPATAPLTLFSIGRCVGWIAHALEQYRRPELIRPRARYVGEEPQEAIRRA